MCNLYRSQYLKHSRQILKRKTENFNFIIYKYLKSVAVLSHFIIHSELTTICLFLFKSLNLQIYKIQEATITLMQKKQHVNRHSIHNIKVCMITYIFSFYYKQWQRIPGIVSTSWVCVRHQGEMWFRSCHPDATYCGLWIACLSKYFQSVN